MVSTVSFSGATFYVRKHALNTGQQAAYEALLTETRRTTDAEGERLIACQTILDKTPQAIDVLTFDKGSVNKSGKSGFNWVNRLTTLLQSQADSLGKPAGKAYGLSTNDPEKGYISTGVFVRPGLFVKDNSPEAQEHPLRHHRHVMVLHQASEAKRLYSEVKGFRNTDLSAFVTD